MSSDSRKTWVVEWFDKKYGNWHALTGFMVRAAAFREMQLRREDFKKTEKKSHFRVVVYVPRKGGK